LSPIAFSIEAASIGNSPAWQAATIATTW